ncbi:PREDICTED: uncharacterized protein LOC106102001 [Papilio polytes]|uniref:uncharacterized protein LOC106102001 n=1 Tax=Papilio polytes TaxID=76194 RepID=UPI000675EF09|nr:PREDICTED: uncharacterized protein LOC106102001 [Papilio polytes]
MNFDKYKHTDAVKECLKIPRSPNSCDRDICFANKMGFASSDGKVDKNEFKNHLENNNQIDTELKNQILDSCAEGDLDKFGTEDICDVKKLKLCVDLQVFSLCKNWDTDGPCAGVQELAEECAELYS